MGDEGILLGAAGVAVLRLQSAERDQGDRRAQARMTSAAPYPPQFITLNSNVGEWDRLHVPVPLPRNKCARTRTVTAWGRATGPRTPQ